ncbi:MAG: hypothetical protein ACREP7_13215 [Lysobacter sp.]
MAVTTHLPKVLLSSIAVILLALAWRPWDQNRQSQSADSTHTNTQAPAAQGAADSGINPADTLSAKPSPQIAIAERMRSIAPQAQPPNTYIGPDGKPHEIVYNQGLNLSPGTREQLKRELLAQMQQHPDAVSRIYAISKGDIAAVVAGTKPFPEELLNQ